MAKQRAAILKRTRNEENELAVARPLLITKSDEPIIEKANTEATEKQRQSADGMDTSSTPAPPSKHATWLEKAVDEVSRWLFQ